MHGHIKWLIQGHIVFQWEYTEIDIPSAYRTFSILGLIESYTANLQKTNGTKHFCSKRGSRTCQWLADMLSLSWPQCITSSFSGTRSVMEQGNTWSSQQRSRRIPAVMPYVFLGILGKQYMCSSEDKDCQSAPYIATREFGEKPLWCFVTDLDGSDL